MRVVVRQGFYCIGIIAGYDIIIDYYIISIVLDYYINIVIDYYIEMQLII